MKKAVIILTIFISSLISKGQTEDPAFQLTYELSRSLARDLFDLNGVEIMQPSVEVLNAVSNSRFFYTAHVNETDKLKVRFGVHGMLGAVPNSSRSFRPELPQEQYNFDTLVGKIDLQNLNQLDLNSPENVELVSYIFKTIIYDGIQEGSIEVPESAATLLGKDEGNLVLPPDDLSRLASARIDQIVEDMENDPFYSLAVPFLEGQLDSLDNLFQTAFQPLGTFPLPTGGDIRNVLAGVPQLDLQYRGFELNLRYIPKLDYGDEFGNFGFFGVGLKNMISQYFYGPEVTDFRDKWNVAIQAAFQNTSLDNTIGVTQAKLESNASIYNFNIHASKMVENWFEVFGGLSYEYIDIQTTYTYTLDSRIQQSIRDTYGLSNDPNDDNFWEDDQPQIANIPITDSNIKATLGLNRSIGPIDIFAAYSISQFNIFSFGLAANF